MEYAGPEQPRLSERQKQQLRNWVTGEITKYGGDPQAFDVDAEMDDTLTVSENMSMLGKKMKERGLFGEEKIVEEHRRRDWRREAQEQDRQLQEDADRLYMESRKKLRQEQGPQYKEIPGVAGRRFEGNIPESKEPATGPLNPYEPKEEGVRMEAINPEQNIFQKVVSGVQGAYASYQKESEYARRQKMEERTMKAVAGIGERSKRLAVSELERRERELARMEFSQSTAGKMIAGIREVGSAIHERNQTRHGGMGGSSLLREALVGKKGKGAGPGVSLSLRPSSSYIGEGRSSMLSSFIGGGAVAPGGRQHGGHYVTVVERGVARRVYVPAAGGSAQGQLPSGPTQPAVQSPLASAMFGGSQLSGRTAERPSALSMAMMGGMMGGPKGRKETGTPLLAMAIGGHGGGKAENHPTLLQQATFGGNKGHNLFAGATSKSHNSLFAAAMNNTRSKNKFGWK